MVATASLRAPMAKDAGQDKTKGHAKSQGP